jgi:hypothetical protein
MAIRNGSLCDPRLATTCPVARVVEVHDVAETG